MNTKSIAAIAAIGSNSYLDSKNNTNEEMTLGIEKSILPSIVWIAEHNGYFEDEGLALTLIEHDSGRNALNQMISGNNNLNMVTVAQTPIVFNSFENENFQILTSMVSSTKDVKLLGLEDSGIKTLQDLRGKKIGITFGSTGHYFLEHLLSENDLSISDVEIFDIHASELPFTIFEKRVDAIVSWEPHIFQTEKILKENYVIFTSDSFVEEFYFVVNNDFKENSSTLKKFFLALYRAEAFIDANPNESKKIVSDRLRIDYDFIDNVWNDFEFEISLDSSLIHSLDDEAQWAKTLEPYSQKDIPDFHNFVDYNFLVEFN